MFNTEKIFKRYEDVHVRAVVIYNYNGNGSASKSDRQLHEFTSDELREAFFTGAVIECDGVFYKPLSLCQNAGLLAISYMDGENVKYVRAYGDQ